MKRFFLLLLATVLLLSACGTPAPAAEPTQPPTEAPTQAPTEAPTEPATEPPTQPPTEAPTEPVVYRHPLTGALLDQVWVNRPVAVAVNNYPTAVPQSGISFADLIYEIESEGNVTRFLTFFTDLSQVGTIGSIRSVRTYLNSIIAAYDSVILHVGCSKFAENGGCDEAGNRLSPWNNIDLMFHPTYSFRDEGRLAQGYDWEHTLCTTGELFAQALKEQGYATTNPAGFDYGLVFAEESGIQGQSAQTLTVTFPGGKTTTFTYQEDTGLYTGSQFGDTWIDSSENGEIPMTFRNVLTLETTRTRPEGVHSFYDLIGSGEGTFTCDGQSVSILWSRPDVNSPFSYTLEDGTPVTFGVGKVYIAILSEGGSVLAQ